MKQQCLSFTILFGFIITIAACSQETNTSDWNPNTKLLDLAAKRHDRFTGDAGSTLAHDVENFYQLLRDKKWHETYELRAKAYREDRLESDYLAEAKKAEKLWGLVNYEVLSVQFQNSIPDATNIDQAVLICKFTELPDNEVSYSTVYWHKEDGVWKCLSAGPVKLEIFEGLRPPVIDWR
ncbi:MAG TPA: hypothetical protein VIK35_06270 [Verrucomicrobiae bacterium]